MKQLFTILAFLCLTFTNCSKLESEFPKEKNLSSQSETSKEYSSFIQSLVISSRSSIGVQGSIKSDVQQLIKIDYFILTKIAESSITLSEIKTLTDDELIRRNVFGASEWDSLKSIIKATGSSLRSKLGSAATAECLSCNTDESEKLNKLSHIVGLLRDKQQNYVSQFSSYLNKLALMDFPSGTSTPMVQESEGGDGPDCSTAFYVCLGTCSLVTEGIGAAACIYLCACSYCQLKPPGC
ncbi:MAG: hypothetical protein JST63_18980 [Bacteroidetes bacterium]|nr:hypothetical protein [Bacteroidota bacterium]